MMEATGDGRGKIGYVIRMIRFQSSWSRRPFLSFVLAAALAALPGLVIGLAIGLVPGPARAGVGPWVTFEGGMVRLVSAGPLTDGTYGAGLEFALEPGWHTYWMHPGEAGIPPELDARPSSNIATVAVQFPYPERYDDGFSQSNIYKDGVLLPLVVTPQDPARPVDLDLTVTFGICKEICIPGEARVALALEPAAQPDPASARAIARALADVPGAPGPDSPQVSRLFLRKDPQKEKLDISLALPAGLTLDDVSVFVAAPDALSLGVPRRRQPDWKKATGDWVLALSGLPKSRKEVTLSFVLVARGKAVTQTVRLNRDTGVAVAIDAPPSLAATR
ncbi:hypothetical protein GWI71_12115 [Microvirga tunisiensis]|uniref:Thiol:disulfide interchange protein DsbD N-terminal domain-containing protein n=2 Tax=Pannonibacter tanglangensis TaxID=2750084 RepID=A0ABW9ZHT8_9HYPH|nr:hypothetical protein [Pannonibacter sp. XCT-34]